MVIFYTSVIFSLRSHKALEYQGNFTDEEKGKQKVKIILLKEIL